MVIHNFFKGYIPFIVTAKYWLYSLDCTIHPCSLFYYLFIYFFGRAAQLVES